MAGYIGSKSSVTVTSTETDSRYVNTSGDTMTGDLTVEGNITSNSGNGNFVSLTTDGAIEIKKSNGEGYIDFKDGDEDLDCRIAQRNNGFEFTTGGSGSPANVLTLDSNGDVSIGYASTVFQSAARRVLRVDGGSQSILALTSNNAAQSSYLYYDGNLSLTNSTAGGGVYISTAGATGFSMNQSGHITTPVQPACVAHTGAAWLNMQANTSYGIGPALHYNRGGFYNGGALGGYNVVHVPASGLYRVVLTIYLAGNHAGRIYVRKNNATDICFIQTVSTSVDSIQTAEGLIEMNAYDYLNYYLTNTLNTYHGNLHTYVTAELIG